MIDNYHLDDTSVLEASANLLELSTSKDSYVEVTDETISTRKLTDAQLKALYSERYSGYANNLCKFKC